MSGMVRPSGTYETLDEQLERLSPAEEGFERARPTIELFLGPVVFLGLYLLPPAATPEQQALAAIFAFAFVYWLPISTLLTPASTALA
jgi:solute carrier family 13 (sodium-dependent dicarboxylate transporter), member 2/3/5